MRSEAQGRVPLAGADGCKRGWILVQAPDVGGPVTHAVCATADALLAALAPRALLAIDIPIGLRDDLDRTADRLARRAVGPRSSSVFPAPIRAVLDAASYEEAKAISFAAVGKMPTIQAYHITAKIREIDLALRAAPATAARVHEVHPEVSFTVLNDGVPMRHAKRERAGHAERLALVERVFPGAYASIRRAYLAKDVAHDDILDALVALWSASRIRDGRARSFPEGEPPRDAFGLPMVIRA